MKGFLAPYILLIIYGGLMGQAVFQLDIPSLFLHPPITENSKITKIFDDK